MHKIRFGVTLLAVVGAGVARAAVAMATTPAVETISVTIEELRSKPTLYIGRLVQVSGIMLAGFEAGPALSDDVVWRGGVAGGNFKSLKEPSIFLVNPVVEHERTCVSQTGMYPVTFCTVDVTGTFEYGGRSGHLGAYQFQIRGSALPPTGQPETQAVRLESVEPVGTVAIEAQPGQPTTAVPVQAVPSPYAVSSQQPARPLQAPAVGSSQPTRASESGAGGVQPAQVGN